jgi:hypothetical protein
VLKTVCGPALALVLAACAFPTSDPKAEALAKTAFEQLRAGDYQAQIAETSKADWGPNPQPMLERMHGALPAGDPGPGKLVGFNSYAGTGGATLTLNIQYDYPDTRVLSSTVLAKDEKRPQGWIIRGFHVQVDAVQAPPARQPQAKPPAKPLPKPQQT